MGGIGKLLQLRGTGGIAVREGELALELRELIFVVLERRPRRARGGVGERIRVDERVAVVVAADPRAGAHESGFGKLQPEGLLEALADGTVERRNLLEQGKLVVAQRDVNLVFEGRARDADERGLPQQRHTQVQLAFNVRLIAAEMPLLEELLNACLSIEDRAAASFRGVRGKDRRDHGITDDAGSLSRGDRRILELVKGRAQGDRRRHGLVRKVLDQVGKQREVGEGASDEVGLRDVEVAEDGKQVLSAGVPVGDIES